MAPYELSNHEDEISCEGTTSPCLLLRDSETSFLLKSYHRSAYSKLIHYLVSVESQEQPMDKKQESELRFLFEALLFSISEKL